MVVVAVVVLLGTGGGVRGGRAGAADVVRSDGERGFCFTVPPRDRPWFGVWSVAAALHRSRAAAARAHHQQENTNMFASPKQKLGDYDNCLITGTYKRAPAMPLPTLTVGGRSSSGT